MNIERSSKNSSSCCGVILAAGRGTRMNLWEHSIPKALLPVGGRAILSRQISLMKSLKISTIHIVVGHLKEMIIDYVQTLSPKAVNIHFHEQQGGYGSGAALLTVAPYVSGPFWLFLGDILISPRDMQDLMLPIVANEAAAVLSVVYDTNPEHIRRNFTVALDSHGLVRKLIEKPTGVASGLKGCGIYAFTPAIFSSLTQTPLDVRGELGITEGIQTLINAGYKVTIAIISDWDLNVTTPEDLELADSYLLTRESS